MMAQLRVTRLKPSNEIYAFDFLLPFAYLAPAETGPFHTAAVICAPFSGHRGQSQRNHSNPLWVGPVILYVTFFLPFQVLTFQMAEGDMDNIVLAVGQKKTVQKQYKDLEDLVRLWGRMGWAG